MKRLLLPLHFCSVLPLLQLPQTTQSFCTNATIASLQPQGANIVWYVTATSTTPLANTTPLVAGSTYYVAQRNGSCESLRAAVNVVYSNTLSLTVPAPLTIACDDANIATTVGNWLNQATVTDTCGTATPYPQLHCGETDGLV